jgi:hypothetical protein
MGVETLSGRSLRDGERSESDQVHLAVTLEAAFDRLEHTIGGTLGRSQGSPVT